ncbi:MAG: DMT family transporter [Pseudomonadota bacterium]
MRSETASTPSDGEGKQEANPNILLGVASAVAVIFIWSGFIVFSRAGVVTSLTAFDITALRFTVAGLLVLPFAYAWWPRHLSLKAQAIMALCGPGAVYSILVYLGLSEASAAYGGVFANGSLPIFTLLLLFVLSGERPKSHQFMAVGIIMAGGVLLGLPGMMAGGADVMTGIALFLFGSAILSVYIVGVRRWALTPKQALALINVPNALIFLPLWFLFLPSGIADADLSTVLFQAAFQGLGPGFLAVILFALAAFHLGPTPTAGFSAAVPATAALLAVPVLSEVPGPMEWGGIVIVTVGLALLVAKR